MKRTTVAGLSVAAILVIVVLMALVVFRHQIGGAWRDAQQMRRDLAEGRRFPQALAAAKAQGLPTQMAAMQKPLPPPARNAAPIYVRLTRMLKDHPFTASEKAAMTLHPGIDPSEAQWAQIARLLHDRSGELALVHQAALRPDCVFTRNWTTPNPADILFPELSTVRASARLLEMESLLLAHQRKFVAAARNQALGFQIVQHGASDGTLIAYLVGLAVDAITLNGMQRIVTMAGPDTSLDDTAGTLIARGWKPLSLSITLRSEVAFQQGIIMYLHKTGPSGLQTINPDVHKAWMSQKAWDEILDYNGVWLLEHMEEVVPAADKPYRESYPILNSFYIQAADTHHSARFIAAIVAPDLGVAAGKGPQIQALADVTRAGAAVLAQTARQGHPPDRLPSAFLDPYSGKPLGYRREGAQGFVIYSAGAAGHFDGGKPGEYWWKPYQIAFRYPGAAPH